MKVTRSPLKHVSSFKHYLIFLTISKNKNIRSRLSDARVFSTDLLVRKMQQMINQRGGFWEEVEAGAGWRGIVRLAPPLLCNVYTLYSYMESELVGYTRSTCRLHFAWLFNHKNKRLKRKKKTEKNLVWKRRTDFSSRPAPS